MCTDVVVHRKNGEKVCRTQGELAAEIGCDNIVLESGATLCPELCLCSLDGPATAKRAGAAWIPVHGWRFEEGDTDPFDAYMVFDGIRNETAEQSANG